MEETRRTKMTKKMIKDAFLELLEEQKTDKISVTDICKRADVNRSTFYAYYYDVETLLHEIENEVLERIPVTDSLNAIYSDNGYLSLLENFFGYLQENERVFRLLMIQADNSHFNRRLVNTVMEKYNMLSNIEDPLLARYGYIFVINGVIGLVKEWISGKFPVSARKFSEIVLKMSLRSNQINDIDMK